MVSKYPTTTVSPIPLVCPVQHYAWGCGSEGLVAQLSHDQTGSPCAELWMGTHPSGPAKLLANGQLLSEHVNKSLSFLLKVLSVKTALSIQAHPDKQLAKVLHARDPKNYPDANHKPEMAIALTRFEALCSFRQQQQVIKFWSDIPELSLLAQLDSDIKTMFGQVMHADKDKVVSVGERILKRSEECGGVEEVDLFKRLWNQYPNDVGCFCVFLLNYICLQPGQAIFLPANEPHAYIKGDCVECMAASDNVVRAGLTPKYRDLSTLIDMLSYKQVKADDLIIEPVRGKANSNEYRVAVDEFAVLSNQIAQHTQSTISVDKAAMLIMLAGHGSINDCDYKAGSVFYLALGEYKIDALSDSRFYMAFEP